MRKNRLMPMIDEPTPFDSLEIWEDYLATLKSLPDDVLDKEDSIKWAEKKIARIRKEKA